MMQGNCSNERAKSPPMLPETASTSWIYNWFIQTVGYRVKCGTAQKRRVGPPSALRPRGKLTAYRKFDGTYLAEQFVEPDQPVMALKVPCAVRIRLQAPAPVFVVPMVITPPATVVVATYCVASVEQPDALVSAGNEPLVDAYSATEVLHAAAAATPSDIFERTT